MTPQDIEDAVESGVKKVLDERDRGKAFRIPPKEHYQHHKFIEKMMNWVERTADTAWGAIVKLIVWGFIILLVCGVVAFVGKEVLTSIGREVITK